jgi:hypothetical protein
MAGEELTEYQGTGREIAEHVVEHTDYAPVEYTGGDYPEVRSEPETYLDESSNGESDLIPFKFWDKKAKSIFKRSSLAVKKAWTNTQRRADARAYQVINELKNKYAMWDEMANVLMPYIEAIHATGMSIPEYIELTIKADAELTNNPVEFICAVMDRFDIYPLHIEENFKGFYQRRAERERMAPLQKELQDVKTRQFQQELIAEQQRYDEMVYDFFSQEDQRGEPIYPYAQELAPLMQVIVDATGNTDLDTVYNMALSAADEEARALERKQGAESREGEFSINKDNEYPREENYVPADSLDAKAKRRETILRSLENAMARYGVQS